MLDYQRVPISRNLFFQLVETHSSVSCDHVHTQHFVLTWDTGGGRGAGGGGGGGGREGVTSVVVSYGGITGVSRIKQWINFTAATPRGIGCGFSVAGVCSAVCVSVTSLLLRQRSHSHTFRINNKPRVIINIIIMLLPFCCYCRIIIISVIIDIYVTTLPINQKGSKAVIVVI